jgi:hypothetical protein
MIKFLPLTHTLSLSRQSGANESVTVAGIEMIVVDNSPDACLGESTDTVKDPQSESDTKRLVVVRQT